MAERRMFAKTIIDSDAFLDMPSTTQNLYFHLGMRADDDGFINQPKGIMRMIGAKDDDLTLLIAKKFIIPFDNGIVVIKHWKINNYIQKDRYTPTKYSEQLEMLELDENGAYKTPMYTECIQDVYKMDTQVRLGKDRLGKDSIDNNIIASSSNEETAVIVISLPLNDNSLYPIYESKIKYYSKLYPNVDINQQFKNMLGWLNSNPTKRKTRRGIEKFINGWLVKEQDKPSGKRDSGFTSQSKSKIVFEQL